MQVWRFTAIPISDSNKEKSKSYVFVWLQLFKTERSPLNYYFFIFLVGAKPFDCPQCDKLFRTSAHRKSHIQSHFKDLQDDPDGSSRKRAFKRISHKMGDLPDIPLQEPILITDTGKKNLEG